MHEQRKHYYNDHRLQGRLLAALILLQVTLVLSLLAYLHIELNGLIESHLYSFHSAKPASWPEIFSLLLFTIGIFLCVNLAALYLAHLIWGRYVAQTIELFSAGLERMIELDFSADLPAGAAHHRIIELLANWFDKERQRNRDIAQQLNRLQAYAGRQLGESERAELQAILRDYRRLLSG
jgi:hypothetical protein